MRPSPEKPAPKLKDETKGLTFSPDTTVNLTKEKEPLMRQIRDRLQQTSVNANSPFSIDMAILSDELLHWASLTLAYRAIPSPPGSPSTFNPECIHAARRAFECHFEYMSLAGDNVGVKTSFLRW